MSLLTNSIGDIEMVSVHPSVHAWFLTIIWKSDYSIHFKFGVCICWVSVQNWCAFEQHSPNFGPLVAKKPLKMGQNGGFRPLSGKVFTQSKIQFKLVVYTCWVNVQKQFIFGWHWSNCGPLVGKKLLKVGQNCCFTQSNSNLVCTFIGWVFRNDSLLGHVGQILALWWPEHDRKWWCPTIIWKSIYKIQFKLGVYAYWAFRIDLLLGHFGQILALEWPQSD